MKDLEIWTERREKALKFLERYGFLFMKCQDCGADFTCSGHCIEWAQISDFNLPSCYCAKCDGAKTVELPWFRNCDKQHDHLKDLLRFLAVKKKGLSWENEM